MAQWKGRTDYLAGICGVHFIVHSKRHLDQLRKATTFLNGGFQNLPSVDPASSHCPMKIAMALSEKSDSFIWLFFLFFVFFWWLNLCLRRILALKRFCFQWIYISLYHIGRLLGKEQCGWFVDSFLAWGGCLLASHRILNFIPSAYKIKKKKKGGPAKWVLAPCSVHGSCSQSPWLPKICAHRDLPTCLLPPTSHATPLNCPLISWFPLPPTLSYYPTFQTFSFF